MVLSFGVGKSAIPNSVRNDAHLFSTDRLPCAVRHAPLKRHGGVWQEREEKRFEKNVVINGDVNRSLITEGRPAEGQRRGFRCSCRAGSRCCARPSPIRLVL